nr:asparagine synthase-related protein [uncultured Nitrososphaera sp.]
MLQELERALRDAVGAVLPEKNVAVAFSGGVDSALLSIICRDLGKHVTLATVGFPGSHDVSFSKEIASKIGLPHTVVELDHRDFQKDLAHVLQTVTCGNTSHVENCIAYYYIAQAANRLGFSVVASANGCDELFCGYNGYRAVYDKGESAIMEYMESKIENELVLVQEISAVAAEFSVQVRQPFLSAKFVEFAKEKVPMDQKIKDANDMMRKHVLRQAALAMGVPEESALKPKKALQYGSLIHKNYKLSARERKDEMKKSVV